jgi:hypothetical protein
MTWQPGEREALLHRIAEREQRNLAERAAELAEPMSEPSDTEPEAPTMTSTLPLDGAGQVIERSGAGARPHSHMLDRAWIDRRIQKQLMNLAEAVQMHLDEIRTEHERLRAEVVELRRTLDMQRAVSDLAARIGRLEVDAGGSVTTSRPTNGLHHDG